MAAFKTYFQPLNSIRLGILWTGLEKVLVYGINFVQGVILARLLCPEDFGLTAMLGIFLGLGGTLAESGLGTALVIGVRGLAPESLRLERRVLWWNVGTALGLYGLMAAGAPWCAQWYDKPLLTPLLRVMALGLVINASSVVATARLTREERFGPLAWANGLSAIVGAAVAIMLAWRGCGVWSIVGLGLTSAIVRTALAWVLARTDEGQRTKNDGTAAAGASNSMSFREALRYGWKLMASGVIHVFYTESYNIVIGKLWSPAAVGLFVRGQRWAKLPGEVVNEAVGRVALPKLARGAGGAAALRFVSLNALLLWPGLVVLWIWAPQIVGTVLGERWLDCVPYLRILLVGQFFTVGGNIALQQLRASGRSDLILKTDMWKKPVGIAALVCGVPFGVVGLCWAKVVSDVAECVVDVAYAVGVWSPRRDGRRLPDMNVMYRVMSDLRPWLWRFELLIRRPYIRPTTHPDTWCHYLVSLLECGRERAFDRVYARYVRQGGDIAHFAQYFTLSEAAVARGCRDPEVVRTAEVWKSLSASRALRPLSRLVEGKTVAVVGNGPQEVGKGLGTEIDAHDIVIRINNYELAGHEADYGRRTDVWVKNTTVEMRHVKPSSEIRAIVYNGNWNRDQLEFGYRERIAADLADGSVDVDYFGTSDRQEVSEAIRWIPTTGGLALSALRQCACKAVDVYGCSYVNGATGDASAAYRRLPKDVPEDQVAVSVAWHRFDREVAYLSRLIDGRRLKTLTPGYGENEDKSPGDECPDAEEGVDT